jgi:hypothetical protein
MSFALELQQMRAAKMEQGRNARAMKGSTDYRDGYAAAFADYTRFRDPMDQIEKIAALNEKHVAGYNEGYKHARRGVPSRWPKHPTPRNFGFAQEAAK